MTDLKVKLFDMLNPIVNGHRKNSSRLITSIQRAYMYSGFVTNIDSDDSDPFNSDEYEHAQREVVIDSEDFDVFFKEYVDKTGKQELYAFAMVPLDMLVSMDADMVSIIRMHFVNELVIQLDAGVDTFDADLILPAQTLAEKLEHLVYESSISEPAMIYAQRLATIETILNPSACFELNHGLYTDLSTKTVNMQMFRKFTVSDIVKQGTSGTAISHDLKYKCNHRVKVYRNAISVFKLGKMYLGFKGRELTDERDIHLPPHDDAFVDTVQKSLVPSTLSFADPVIYTDPATQQRYVFDRSQIIAANANPYTQEHIDDAFMKSLNTDVCVFCKQDIVPTSHLLIRTIYENPYNGPERKLFCSPKCLSKIDWPKFH